MKAGRELDALVAEKVMGLEITYVGSTPFTHRGTKDEHNVLFYSRDILAAWQVVEKMRERAYNIEIITNDLAVYGVLFTEREVGIGEYGEAPSAPEAICLAALKAVGVETK